MSKAKLDPKKCADWHGWDIAKELGIGYSGDCNVIEHGGYFYSLRDWSRWGYASCVEFYMLWDEPGAILHVEAGTISRPDPEELSRIIQQSGINYEVDPRVLPPDGRMIYPTALEIECARDYWGIEPGYCHDDYRTFNLETWKEWRIWKAVLPMIERLTSD